MIYFILGISGSGKSTLIGNLQKLNLEDLVFPLSYKTREKRDYEVDGIDAHFISKELFEEKLENGEFLEYALVHGDEYYGTSLEDLNKVLDEGKIAIKEIDLNGLLKLKQEKPEFSKNYKTIFLDLPKESLEKRIIQRQSKISKTELQTRLETAIIEEESLRKICDFDLDATKSKEQLLKEILEIIIKEKNIFEL